MEAKEPRAQISLERPHEDNIKEAASAQSLPENEFLGWSTAVHLTYLCCRSIPGLCTAGVPGPRPSDSWQLPQLLISQIAVYSISSRSDDPLWHLFFKEQYLNTKLNSFSRQSYKTKAFQIRLLRVLSWKMDVPEETVLYLLKKDEAAYLKMKQIKPKSRKIILKEWQVTGK